MQDETAHLHQAFTYTSEISLMGFKGELDQMIELITKLYEPLGIGTDLDSYTAYLKLQELRQELLTLHEIRKIKTISLTQKSKDGEEFWFAFQHISNYMKSLITFTEKEKVKLAIALGEQKLYTSQQALKHCANELNRIKHLLQGVYT